MGYELLEHTADVGLRIWADDLDGLFAEAARAVVGVMGHGEGPEAGEVTVALDAPDLDALLVDWLSEMLYVFEAKGIVPDRVDVRVSRDPWHLEGIVAGPDAEAFVQGGPQVKAITYHGLEIRRGPEHLEAVVYVDV